jgi:hypothetical protein
MAGFVLNVGKSYFKTITPTVSQEQEDEALRKLDNPKTYKSPFPDAKSNTSNNSNKYIPEYKEGEKQNKKSEKVNFQSQPTFIEPKPIYNKPIEFYTKPEPPKFEPQRTFLPSNNLYIQRLDNFSRTGSNLPIGPSWLR